MRQIKICVKYKISPVRLFFLVFQNEITHTSRSNLQGNLQYSCRCSHPFHKALGTCPRVDMESFRMDSVDIKTNGRF